MNNESLQSEIRSLRATMTISPNAGKNEITPSVVSKAMCNYYPIVSRIIEIFYNKKIEFDNLKVEYELWYSEKFEMSRKKIFVERAKSNPTTKEIEMKIMRDFSKEFCNYKTEISVLENELAYITKSLNLCSEQQRLLVAISSNMRQELFALQTGGA